MGARFDAFRDLLRRYRTVLGHAWRHRRDMQPPQRLPHEARFLPATLALQETPVHPAPRIVIGLILLFALLTVCWAAFGKIDVVATAGGKIVPDSRSKLIQSIEAGTVEAVHVRDGQSVRAGEPLLVLDTTLARADVERLRGELDSLVLDAKRSQALLAALERGSMSETDFGPVGLGTGQRVVEGTYAAFLSAVAQLEAEITRREAERRATMARAEKLRRTLPIIEQRVRDYQDLLDKRFVSRHHFLELEQTRIEQERELAAQQETLAQISAAIEEALRHKVRIIAETRREWLDRLLVAEERRAVLTQELRKAEARERSFRLDAPVDGIVQQLAVHTLGGVVTPAQPLMVVVPLDSPLEVEAMVANKDIGFVVPGQRVEIKVETFPFTKYGTIDGEILGLSSDAIQHETLGPVFAARVRLARDHLNVDGRQVRLSPGMSVVVEIRIGKRRLFEYFLGPLLQVANESLRER